MLKNIPSILSPELLKILMEMGHGDEIVFGDANFPAANMAKRLVRCDGHGMPELLDAVMRLFPLDGYVDRPAFLMQVVPGDPTKPTIWEEYRRIISKHEPEFTDFESVERFAFYEQARNAYCIVATGEAALYANIILRKGVIAP
jgi:L-fucose mutarotase